MAREPKALCDRCENRIRIGAEFCRSCGYPTMYANHEQRATWELDQYRKKNNDHPLREAYDTRPHSPSPRPGSMTAAAPALTPTLSVVREIQLEPAHKPRSGMLVKARPATRADEPELDRPAAMVAMRLLNARVEDLHAKVRELESELAALRSKPRRRLRH